MALAGNETLADLRRRTARAGRRKWIDLLPTVRASVQAVNHARLIAN
jgi:hypothetical protein